MSASAGPRKRPKASPAAKTSGGAREAAAAGRRQAPARGSAQPAGAAGGARNAAPARATLSRERIVAEALALVAEDGLQGLSTRRLGQRLGIEAMSIYHYFPGKQHLLDALVDHAIASIPAQRAGVAPEEALRRVAYAYRAMARRFPQLYPLIALHRLNTPTGVAFIERVLELVRAVVRSDEDAARQFRAIGYYLTGAALQETAGYARGPSAADPVDEAYVREHCPRLAAAAPYFAVPQWDETFAQGLDALIDGFRRRGRSA